MSKEITVTEFTPEQIELIKNQICKDSTNDELSLFMYIAKKTGLDPFARQIYSVQRWDINSGRFAHTPMTSIDGYRLIAERSGKYAGQRGPFWCGKDGEWKDIWISAENPVAARVGVLRSDFQEPCWGVARYEAYVGRKKDGSITSMWRKMGDLMIAKCAEALALRKAFPQELSGLYTKEEMDQADTSETAQNPAVEPSKSLPQPKATLSDKIDLKQTLGVSEKQIKELARNAQLMGIEDLKTFFTNATGKESSKLWNTDDFEKAQKAVDSLRQPDDFENFKE